MTIVREFMQSTAAKGNLSVCIEKMFENIIAVDVASSGGIGCDNMTAVLIQLKH